MNTTTITNAAIERAAASQERKCAGWQEMALAYLKTYAQFQPEFTTEDVRLASVDLVPVAPEPRAWGQVTKLAAKMGIVAPTKDYVEAKSTHAHKRPLRTWKSLVFAVAA